MRSIMRAVIVVAILAVGGPLFAGGAHAAPAAPPSEVTAAGVQASWQAQGTVNALPGQLTAATPSPSGPANPGTGETGQAEGTRLDWAPLVIGAIVLITLVAVLIWRRRRRDTTVV